jgi:hypothetical protein
VNVSFHASIVRYVRRPGSGVPPLDPTKVLSENANALKFLLRELLLGS